MKKLLLLPLLALAITSIANAQSPNDLGGKKFCLATYPVVLSGTLPGQPNLVSDLTTLMQTRLAAYRILSPGCSPKTNADVFVTIIVTDATIAGYRGISEQLTVIDFASPYPYAPSIWNNTAALVNGNGDLAAFNQIKNTLSDQLDQLGADYVKTNP